MQFLDYFVIGLSPSNKTKIYQVKTKKDGFNVGLIKWYGPWRCYAFFPSENTVYEKTCLKDLSDLLILLNRVHKETLKMAREDDKTIGIVKGILD